MKDAFAGRGDLSPYPAYQHARRHDPVQLSSLGLWTFYRYDDCDAVLRDNRWGRGSGSERLRGQERDREHRRSFLRQDPPEHTRLRRLAAGALSPQVVAALEPRIQQIADDLLDRFLDGGPEADLIESYAYPLPVTVICELLGVPVEDRGEFRVWTTALARGQDPDSALTSDEIQHRNAAIRDFRRYFADLIAQRRHSPGGEDLISRLLEVRAAGSGLSDADLHATCVLLLLAGHETTVNLIGNGTHALLTQPDQLELLQDGALDQDAGWVDELLRFESPVQFMARTALQDLEYGGRQFRKGDSVVLVIASGNRDETVFDDAERLRLDRGRTRHLAFGMGIHFCLGAPLARLEGEIALRTLFRRATKLSLIEKAPATYKKNMVMRGLARLPVRTR